MSDLVASVSLSYQAGKDVEETWTVTQSSTEVDLTGMTLRAVVARELDSTAVLSSSTSPQTITLTASNQTTNTGEFTWAWTDTASEDLHGTYRFEIEVEDTLGLKSTVARGFVTFKHNMI